MALPFAEGDPPDWMIVDVDAEIGDEVVGPEAVFASVLAEVVVTGRDLKHARALAQDVFDRPPVIQRGVTARRRCASLGADDAPDRRC